MTITANVRYGSGLSELPPTSTAWGWLMLRTLTAGHRGPEGPSGATVDRTARRARRDGTRCSRQAGLDGGQPAAGADAGRRSRPRRGRCRGRRNRPGRREPRRSRRRGRDGPPAGGPAGANRDDMTRAGEPDRHLPVEGRVDGRHHGLRRDRAHVTGAERRPSGRPSRPRRGRPTSRVDPRPPAGARPRRGSRPGRPGRPSACSAAVDRTSRRPRQVVEVAQGGGQGAQLGAGAPGRPLCRRLDAAGTAGHDDRDHQRLARTGATQQVREGGQQHRVGDDEGADKPARGEPLPVTGDRVGQPEPHRLPTAARAGSRRRPVRRARAAPVACVPSPPLGLFFFVR